MSLKKVFPYALTALLTLATACGDDDDDGDPTGPGGDTPTLVEVQNMMTALSTALTVALTPSGADGVLAQTIPFEGTGNCPGGGTSTVTGNYTASSQSSFSYTLTQSFNNCKADGNGTVYTFNGTGLTTTADYTISGATYTYDFGQTGTLSWSGGGKSATCSVNWNVDLVYNTGTGGYTYDYGGTFCGVSVTG